MSTTYAWAPITKAERQDDGTVMVYGPATDAGLDRDQQRCNQTWLDKAMPAWMAEGGNVREQHDPFKAAGVGVGLTRAVDGTQLLAACIVDPVTATKCLPGPDGRPAVLKGFSIGIKDAQVTMGKADAPNGEIVGGSICEVSVVDRPSNPRAVFQLAKADGAGHLIATPGPLVEVVGTDVAAQAEQVLADLTALVPAEQLAAPALAKADTADIATAMEATAAIARLIQSEAQGLAAGDLTETCEIGCLLDALRALKYFIAEEQAETGPSATTDAGAQVADDFALAGDVILMADEPTTTKTDAPDGTKTETPDATKSGGTYLTKADLQTMLDGAVHKATEPLGDRLKTVEAELAKALQAPAPGGPVQTRTAVSSASTPDLRAQADHFLAKAATIGRDDPALAQGYRDRAAALLAKTDA